MNSRDEFPEVYTSLDFDPHAFKDPKRGRIENEMNRVVEAIRALRRDVAFNRNRYEALTKAVKKLNNIVIHDYPSDAKEAKYPD